MEEGRNFKVYCHTNLTNGKKYIGQTEQKVERRWRKGGIGYKPQKGRISHFWNSICKYTWDGFKHEVLHDNLTADEADYWEKYYIKEWDLMNPDKGYNEKEGGDGCKMSENLSNIIKNNNIKYKGKKIICLETKEIFDSMGIASRELNIDRASIYAVCIEKRKSAKGLHFLFLENYDIKKDYSFLMRNTKNKKQVICIDTGQIFNSIKECAEKLNLQATKISSVCNKKRKTTGGLHFKFYIDKNK